MDGILKIVILSKFYGCRVWVVYCINFIFVVDIKVV